MCEISPAEVSVEGITGPEAEIGNFDFLNFRVTHQNDIPFDRAHRVEQLL